MKGAQEKSEGLCSAVARGAEEHLWLLAHEFRCSACNAGLGTFPKSLLPYLLHHWPLMKLARVLSAAWMEKENSSQRVFLSSDSVLPLCLPFMWHTLHVSSSHGQWRVPLTQNPASCTLQRSENEKLCQGQKLQSGALLFAGPIGRYI